MKKQENLKALREKIDAADEKIIKLLNQRARIAQKIGKHKNTRDLAVFSPRREAEVYRKIKALNQGPLPDQAIQDIYREVMSGAIALERGIHVCYYGPAGTFTEQAARAKFGQAVHYVSADTIAGVFEDVSRGKSEYGVVPVENSTEGGIRETMDAFAHYHLSVCSEVLLQIHHNLMRCKTKGPIKRIYSKSTVFTQCRSWLLSNHPEAELIDVGSTTQAAQRAAKDSESAAIASEPAAGLYKLKIVARSIEDRSDNITRFLIIANHQDTPTGNDKTSIMLALNNDVGALWKLLNHFTKHDINLARIESRPSPHEAWEYIFFIDLLGHTEDKNVQKAIEEVQKHVKMFKVLGAYPRCETKVN